MKISFKIFPSDFLLKVEYLSNWVQKSPVLTLVDILEVYDLMEAYDEDDDLDELDDKVSDVYVQFLLLSIMIRKSECVHCSAIPH